MRNKSQPPTPNIKLYRAFESPSDEMAKNTIPRWYAKSKKDLLFKLGRHSHKVTDSKPQDIENVQISKCRKKMKINNSRPAGFTDHCWHR